MIQKLRKWLYTRKEVPGLNPAETYRLVCTCGTWTVILKKQTIFYNKRGTGISGYVGDTKYWLRCSTGDWHKWDTGDRLMHQALFRSQCAALDFVDQDRRDRVAERAWEALGADTPRI